MQVSHIAESVNSIVIGGQESIDFTADDSPEFFHILSTSLYSNPLLAVVRETICNAWDAHIESGCTDQPIEVYIEDEYLYIRDFGKGIPPELIGPIYGKYGGSTKKKNKNVTGGFGLGCKSPFAITENFEVTSMNQGIKTVYVMSKSSGAVNGKPSITPIVSVPTKETGVQVKIKINDEKLTLEYIKQVINLGGIYAKDKLEFYPYIDYNKITDNHFITHDNVYGVNDFNKVIFIKIGNVIYPIEEASEYSLEYQKLTKIFRDFNNQLSKNYNKFTYKIIFIAEPDKIAITPSRESLNYLDLTKDYISKILKSFFENHNTKLISLDEFFKYIIDTAEISDVFDNTYHKGVNNSKFGYINFINKFNNKYSNLNLILSLPRYNKIKQDCLLESYGFTNKILKKILKKFDPNVYNPVLTNSLIKTYTKEFSSKDKIYFNIKWFYNKIVKPLSRKMSEDSNSLNFQNLYFNVNNSYYDNNNFSLINWLEIKKSLSKRWANERYLIEFKSLFNFCKKEIVISFNKNDLKYNTHNFKALNNKSNLKLVYIAPRHETRLEEVKKFFTDLGYKIIDLTEEQKVKSKIKSSDLYVVKRKNGLIPFKFITNEENKNAAALNNFNDDTALIKNPDYVYLFKDRSNDYTLIGNPLNSFQSIIDLIGENGGITRNKAQHDRYINGGSLDINDYIFQKIEEIISTKEFEDFYSNAPNETYNNLVLNLIYNDKFLYDYFGLGPKIHNKNFKNVLSIINNNKIYIPKTISAKLKMISDNSTSNLINLYEKTLNKKFDYIDISQLNYDFKYNSTEKTKDTMRELIIDIIEG